MIRIYINVIREKVVAVYSVIRKRIYADPVLGSFTYIVLPLYILLVVFNLCFGAPRDFPSNQLINVPEGSSIIELADTLQEIHAIQSPFLFRILVNVSGSNGVIAGDYFFKTPPTVFEIAWRMAHGYYGIDPIRVFIPQGLTRFAIAEMIQKSIPQFDAEAFVAITADIEGYLFPDTYFFLPNVSAREVARTMNDAFFEHISLIEEEIDAFGMPLEDVVIMASLLEKEARQLETKRTIADILWRRIDIGMALQVDAVFHYILDKDTHIVTFDDLKIDSPYNTYTNLGLPPGAIANPGLDSLLAAVTPTPNKYLFYLTGRDGLMHYSVDFEGHKRNRAKYLD